MTKISHTKDGLLIDGEPIEIPTSVAQVLQTEDLVIVRLDPDEEYDEARNVWAFDEDARLNWKIERAAKKVTCIIDIRTFGSMMVNFGRITGTELAIG